MKPARLALALAVVAALCLAACTRSLPIALPASASVTVFSGGAERTYTPGSAGHAAVSGWLAVHQSGWSPYLATPPAAGALIRAPGIDVQVLGTTAIAHTPDGVFTRTVDAAGLSFLGE